MTSNPVDDGARRRLLDAQRAESQALRGVMAAARKVQALQGRVDAADRDLADAQAILVSISGVSRAAQLLELDERQLQRRVQRAERASETS
jgi:hypothetical protein